MYTIAHYVKIKPMKFLRYRAVTGIEPGPSGLERGDIITRPPWQHGIYSSSSHSPSWCPSSGAALKYRQRIAHKSDGLESYVITIRPPRIFEN